MVKDEPTLWKSIPKHQRNRVMLASKVMCRTFGSDDGDERDHCADCGTPEGGSCVAFGLFGNMAAAVVAALETEAINRIMGEIRKEPQRKKPRAALAVQQEGEP